MVALLAQSKCFTEAKLEDRSLRQALQAMGGDPPSGIPFLVRLLENPDSPIALPGKIDLYHHDCLHVLLDRGFSLEDEAFVIGFTMGNDVQTNWLHVAIFKLCSFLFYTKSYRFRWAHFKSFDLGAAYGRSIKDKNLNRFDFSSYQDQPLAVLRRFLGIKSPAGIVNRPLNPPILGDFEARF